MSIFRVDPYKTCRGISFFLGFFTPVLPFAILVQRKPQSPGDVLIALALFILLPLSIWLHYWREYLVIDGDVLRIATLLRQEKIPIRKIHHLSYEFSGRALMLYVFFDFEGRLKWKRFGVDFMSTANINAMHDGLLAVNPSIAIQTDKLSKEAQETNEKNLRKIPNGLVGWVLLVLKWFGIGAAFQIWLLLMFAPKK